MYEDLQGLKKNLLAFCSFWETGCHQEERTANESGSSSSASISHFTLSNFYPFELTFLLLSSLKPGVLHFPPFKAKLGRNDQEGRECPKKAALSHYKNKTRQ